jgi:hypothetical protein
MRGEVLPEVTGLLDQPQQLKNERVKFIPVTESLNL